MNYIVMIKLYCNDSLSLRKQMKFVFAAPQLKISEDRMTVTGDKGYSMVRATHGMFNCFLLCYNINLLPPVLCCCFSVF